jgi:hypothetical protein
MNNSKISVPGIISVVGAWIKLPQPAAAGLHPEENSYICNKELYFSKLQSPNTYHHTSDDVNKNNMTSGLQFLLLKDYLLFHVSLPLTQFS